MPDMYICDTVSSMTCYVYSYSYALRVPYLSILSDDYSSLPLDCRLEPGDTSQCVEITITDDDLVELTESFSVSLSTVATLEIVQDTAVVYIEDNDSEFIVNIHRPTY